MGCVLGIGIPAFIVAVFALLIWLVVRGGLKKKKRNLALKRYAEGRGYRYVGGDLDGRLEGDLDGRRFSIEFALVQCSADPAADARSPVARMLRQETVLRLALPGATRRALVGKPFFRDAVHDPLRGGQPLDLGDAGFHQVFRVLAPPGEGCEWLDAEARATLLRLEARELRLDAGELSLNLDRMIPSPKRLDLSLKLMTDLAGRVS
jgi:hypothetical protein